MRFGNEQASVGPLRSGMDYVHKLKRVLPRSLHPYLGVVRRWVRTLPARTRRQKERLLDDPVLEARELELLKQVETRISAGDGMYTRNGAHYYRVGLSAISSIEEAFDAARPKSMNRILDQFSLGAQFDLIWCGSLVTHLNDTGIRSLLAFFARHLQPDGLLIFTAHGERVIQRMLNYEFDYGITPESVAATIEAYRKEGCGFADYPGASAYGVSLTSPEWIRRAATEIGLEEVYFRAHGWDDHQDVYGFTFQNLI